MPDLSGLAADPQGDPLMSNEHSRQAFETWHLLNHPGIAVTRKGSQYTKQQVNNRWALWQDCWGIALGGPITRSCTACAGTGMRPGSNGSLHSCDVCRGSGKQALSPVN